MKTLPKNNSKNLPKDEIKRLYDSGWSYERIGKKYGCVIETVRRYFKKYGIFKKWEGHRSDINWRIEEKCGEMVKAQNK